MREPLLEDRKSKLEIRNSALIYLPLPIWCCSGGNAAV